jgi:hypothetical protein
MKLDRVVLSCALVVSSGCGAKNDSAPPDAFQHAITVKASERHFSPSGESISPSKSSVRQSYLRDAAGGFDGMLGGTRDGDTAVIDARDGVLYLGISDNGDSGLEFVVGPRDQVDASVIRRGRATSLDLGTVTASFTGLVAWRGGDRLEAIAPSLDTDTGIGFLPAPTIGVTSIGPVTGASEFRVRASLGDDLWVLQQHTDSVANVSYTNIESALHRSDIEQTTNTADVGGAFTTLDLQHLDLDVQLSQFAALASTTPSMLSPRATVFVQAYGMPELLTVPLSDFAGNANGLPLMSMDLKFAQADPVVASLPFGNPFPSAWPAYVAFLMDGLPGGYTLPGATTPLVFRGKQYLELPLGDAGAGPIAPMIGPAHDLLVDARPPHQATQISVTPTLSWQPPTLGSARGYAIDLFELSLAPGGAVMTRQLARLLTVDTTVQVAPKILQPGKTYFYTVTAMSGDLDVLAAPRVKHGAYGANSVPSDSFTL